MVGISSPDQSSIRVVLWGPPGSGKTCLVNALLDSLREFRQAGLNFFLEEIQNNPDLANTSEIPSEVTPSLWWAGRKQANNRSAIHRHDLKLTVSLHHHLLEVYDPFGIERLQPLGKSSSLADAQLLILVLDPTQLDAFMLVNDSLSSSPTTPSIDEKLIDLSEFVGRSIFYKEIQARSVQNVALYEHGRITQSGYVNYIRSFPGFLQNSEQRVVVCITKKDMLPLNDHKRDPKELLYEYFGADMERLLTPRFELNDQSISIVAVSCLDESDRAIGDLNGEDDFAQVERIRTILLELLQAREYTRLMSAPWLFRRENLKSYIPYFEGDQT